MIEVIGYFIGIGLAFMTVVAVIKGTPSCSGNCNQGRTKCDCKNIF